MITTSDMEASSGDHSRPADYRGARPRHRSGRIWRSVAAVGIVGKRKQDEDEAQRQVQGAGKALWLESCRSCGRPMTVLAVTKPESVLCDRCSDAG